MQEKIDWRPASIYSLIIWLFLDMFQGSNFYLAINTTDPIKTKLQQSEITAS